ncbi:MAG: 2-dehydro-3-deoxygalactonokinase [Firmicutes bacterium]|nr:2-dehydro-3-deoxygalactonokinase [Bacillota bacterium]
MYLFYFDSGTSNSRGYLLSDGKVIATEKVALGSKDVSETGDRTILPRGLKNLYDRVLAKAGVADEQVSKIYGSGMISSPFGLVEVPHALAPFSAKELAEAIYPYEETQYFHRTIHIIPGAKTASGKVSLKEIPTVNNVRGEEIEAIGVKDFVPPHWKEGKYIILFPGSHTHVLLFEGDRIIDILSNFSGEVFHALTTATILAGSTKVEAADAPAMPDPEAVTMGLAALRDYGFARAVYTVHATKVFDACDNAMRRHMLSSIVIGTVFQSLSLCLQSKWQGVARLAVYGTPSSIFTCTKAAETFIPDLEVVGISNEEDGRICSVRGLLHILEEITEEDQ